MIGAYALIYVVVFALALPVGAVMTLIGGALFGTVIGTVVVSFASSVGATFAFLAARYLLADSVRKRFGSRLSEVDRGVAAEGAFYLFTLRLIPVIPPAAINLLFGLTKMRPWTFYWVSQLGMLLGTIVYVNAGTQLAQLETLSGILSPALIGSFVLLGRAAADRPPHRRRHTFAQGLRALGGGEAETLRSQSGRHRRGCCRADRELHRRGREGQGHPGREPQDGRRLPELWLRTE